MLRLARRDNARSWLAVIALPLLVVLLAGCNRFIGHEQPNMYDSTDSVGGTFQSSVVTSTPKPYEESKVAQVSLNQDPQSPAKVRGTLVLESPNVYGYYGGAFYFPPGTLAGPSPKQQLDLDVARWDYGTGEDEFGGLRIGADHQVRLIRGQAGQQPSTIGSPFSFQEGCWNWVVVYQRLTDDPAQRLNRVYLNGEQVVSADADPNWFGHAAERVRFGAVSTGTGAQPAFDFYIDKTFISNDSPEPPPTANACDPVLGGADPSAISTSAQTPVANATSFLYSGDFPTQHGVSAGTIDEERGAVIVGKVEKRLPAAVNGKGPLQGVRVTVAGHPEFGYTQSNADGNYYMAVNGGGALRVRLEKEDYAPVERVVDVPWQDYSAVEDVVMTPLDDNESSVDLSNQNTTPFQVARGSVITDDSGSRQATLFFADETTATMRMPDGSAQPIAQPMTVRATEYTVGDNGPDAMPAELPPGSGYTYAVDYTVDQAVAAGAASVEFTGNKVISYTDNFLGMPVGATVPAGYYDSAKGAWIPSESGRVIRVINNDGGIANLAVTSSDQEATQSELDDLGITQAEREKLAEVYPNIPPGGKSLWRARLTHFTSFDYNWARRPENDVPPEAGPATTNSQDDNCQQPGSSSIGCEDQVLGEDLGVTGSKFGLSYRSDRSAARKANNEINVPLTDSTPPMGLQHVELRIEIAGQHETLRFSGAADQSHPYVWDGKDAFGRTLQGEHLATVSIGYSYAGRYLEGELFADYGNGTVISASTSRDEVTFWRSFTAKVGTWDADREGLGGWTLDVHHRYDPNTQTLHMGDGSRRSTQDLNRVISTVAGGGTSNADDVDATTADINHASGVAVAPDGSVYYSDYFHDRVRRIGPDGKVRTVVGTFDWFQAWRDGRCAPDPPDDGIPAATTDVNGPDGLDIGPDGSLYIADRLCNRIRRISPHGILYTVATISQPRDVAVASDGTLFVANETSVVRIDRNGGSETIASELPSSSIHFYGVEVGPDDTAYYTLAGTVQRLNPDGTITRVAGTAVGDFGSSGDGGAATNAKLGAQNDIAVLPDGSFYIADGSNHRLRYVNSDGIITRVAGKLDQDGNPQSGFAGDGGPAPGALTALNGPSRVALAPGGIYIADTQNNRLRFISAPMPSFSGDDIAIPSEDGSELYQFDKFGRHLRTVNALTGATLYTFGYTDGLLTSITDGESTPNVTQIQRTAGDPTAIIAPFGQQTSLTVSGGRLATVTNPDNEQVGLGYASGCTGAPNGLLSSVTDARNNTSTYCYDSTGRLAKANDRAAGYKTLDRAQVLNGYETSVRSKLGRTTRYSATRDANGDLTRTLTDPAGFETDLDVRQDGSKRLVSPDGTRVDVVRGGDPRFQIQAPALQSHKTTTPGGRVRDIQTSRETTPASPSDPLSIQTLTDRFAVNGRNPFTTVYTAVDRRFVTTSPEGRTNTTDIDPQGRITRQEAPQVNPVVSTYETRGRLEDVQQGTRNWHYTYEPGTGLLDTVTDPTLRVTSFDYDLAGRLKKQTLPGGRELLYDYDDNGNLSSVTPPARTAHLFDHNAVDLVDSYTPPQVLPDPLQPTTYAYNDDQQLEKITRPVGEEIDFVYETTADPNDDDTRRLDYFDQGTGRTDVGYHAQTGTVSSMGVDRNLDGQPEESMAFSYDGSLPTSETYAGTVTGEASRSYDNDLRVAQTKINGAFTVDYTYDNDSLLKTAGPLTLSRNAQNGLLTGLALHKTATTFTPNAYGELDILEASYVDDPQPPVTLFKERVLQRDDLGRIRQKEETTSQGTNHFEYIYHAQKGFLEEVKKNGQTVATYGYDDNGNRLSRTSDGNTATGTYDAQDRLETYDGASYSFTPAGDLESKEKDGQTTSYAYDSLGALENATLPDGTALDYVNDPLGRRIAKKRNGILEQGFLYGTETAGPIAELDPQGDVRSRFVYATRGNVPDYMTRGSTTYRIIKDHLGSPRIVVDSNTGEIAQELDYDEFGNVARDTNPGFQPFGYAGGLYDRDTKLVRFGARDYDAETGRWTARDPSLFAAGDTNLYGYVFSDPVNYKDSSGLSVFDDIYERIPEPAKTPVKTLVRPITAPIDTAIAAGRLGREAIEWGTSEGWCLVKDAADDLYDFLSRHKRDIITLLHASYKILSTGSQGTACGLAIVAFTPAGAVAACAAVLAAGAAADSKLEPVLFEDSYITW